MSWTAKVLDIFTWTLVFFRTLFKPISVLIFINDLPDSVLILMTSIYTSLAAKSDSIDKVKLVTDLENNPQLKQEIVC